jgi:hypothetical protein
VSRGEQSYIATPRLERELARTGTVSLDGGRYRATVITAGLGTFEAYTDTLPFVYGRPAGTLQGALDNLEAAVRAAERARSASRDEAG